MTKEPVDLHTSAPAAGGCQCDHDDSIPVLDVRSIPHAVRHGSVLGALSSLQSGSAMDLVAPHNPVPLLTQIEQRFGGEFTVDYLDSGPETWKLRFARA